MIFECNQKMAFECKGLEDTVNDIASSITDLTDLTNGKLDKTAVVQETGAGTDVVMSQKVVTDELNKKLTRFLTKLLPKLWKLQTLSHKELLVDS